jgi:3-dehydroquinate synthase II
MGRLIFKVFDKFDKNIITFALEKGITEFFTDKQFIDKIRELAKVKIISDDRNADYKLGQDIEYVNIKDKSDETKVVNLAKKNPVIVNLDNWKIIPIENIIAQTDNIIVEVNSFEEMELCSGILEKGINSFLINVTDLNELSKIVNYVKNKNAKFVMSDIEITEVSPLPITDRVCIDTCNLMEIGEGFLIGSSSQCLFLVHSESVENPYVATRPFRVNAGAVHSYIMVNNNKTRYLSEIKAGDDLVTVNYKGDTKPNVTGRIKLEKRPMLLVKGKLDNKEYSVVLQNAETVNLTDVKGKPVSVCKIKPGDKVKCFSEKSGRHFGMSIEETITEK